MVLALSLMLTWSIESGAQSDEYVSPYDTNYVRTFPDKITGRFYLSRKYTNLGIFDDSAGVQLNYEPNTTLNLGIGATVGPFTLNLAYGFNFLNPDQGQGRTRYLDLQSHSYTNKFIIDFFGQFYRGLYLENTSEINPEYEDPYYVRGDIYEQILGGSVLYIFNNKKYSFRSGLMQNEQQLKSAGSWMVGAETYLGLVLGDSAVVPSFTDQLTYTGLQGRDRIAFFKIGPSGGYAHTFVVAQKWFFMIALTMNIGVSTYSTYGPGLERFRDSQFDVGFFSRFALGYNTENWYLGVSSVDNSISAARSPDEVYAIFGIGNIRLNFAKRFIPGPKIKKHIGFLMED
jgi:hypothetical protein